MAAALLSFREGLEAALIVGIVLAYLSKTGSGERARSVWAGVIAACAVSLAGAWALFAIGAQLEGQAEEIFEGVTMLLAALILTWMIFWMDSQSRTIKGDIEQGVQAAASRHGNRALFLLAFLAVVREGIELALFLTAALFASNALETALGALFGLAAAVMAAWLLFTGTRRLNLQRFFAVTSLLLLVIAAGMVGRGVHELNEAGIVTSVVEHLWTTKSMLSDTSPAGAILKALVGYNDDPSLTQVAAYITYALGVVLALMQRRRTVTQ